MTSIPIPQWNHSGASLLWALRSPCDLACQYCYFGTLEDDLATKRVPEVGTLSHRNVRDAPLPDILAFIETFQSNDIHRIFLAGGEPLRWPGIGLVVDALKARGCEVVIATNGLPLNNPELCAWLLDVGVEAVSVSLDSHNPEYNDRWRRDPAGRGWQGVVDGVRLLKSVRQTRGAGTKIGIYSVITKENVGQLGDTARFVASLGVDYFVAQPVSLGREHPLYDTLSLDTSHKDELSEFREAMRVLANLNTPDDLYFDLFRLSMAASPQFLVPSCFGGRDLFFIQPDGTVWDCPSSLKIAATLSEERLSFIGKSAGHVFSRIRRSRSNNCALFSGDCVNMWALIDFDRFLEKP